MKEIDEIIQEDLYRYFGGEESKINIFRGFIFPGFKYTYFMRKVQHLSKNKTVLARVVRLIYGFLLRHYRYKFGFDIPASTSIKPGFYIGHFGNITISSKAQIGSNVNVSPGVAIGVTRASTSFSQPGAPTIGNRVWIGSNAIIVGNIKIGDDALIAPGAYVYFDVPEKSIVRGNPGKILEGNEVGSKGYINRTKA